MNLATVYLLLFLLDLRKKDKRKGLAKQECVEGQSLKKKHTLTAKQRQDGKQCLIMFLNHRSGKVRTVGESGKSYRMKKGQWHCKSEADLHDYESVFCLIKFIVSRETVLRDLAV